MADLATAYLRLIPSLEGSQKAIEKELGGIDANSAGNKLGGNLGEGMKGGIKNVAIGSFLGNMLTGAVDKAALLASETITNAFTNFADFEQLEGGIGTLFGDTTEQAMQNAQKAYESAGLSANEYMETAMGFAAALKASLGDEYAWQMANYADEAVKDMADNANKMGSSMESIQNAYQGFAKQNFTMLDNLKLGYGGTKEEMKRLLRDAEKLEGFKVGSLSENNFADIVTAIHAVQEEMGITGTTAKEASGTISGAIAMTQSAWQNLLTEFGKEDGDISARLDELVNSVGLVLQNAMPVIERVLSSMGEAIGSFAAQAGEYFMQHRTEIYDKAGQFIMGALEAIVTAVPYIVEGIAYLVASLVEYVVTHIPDMLAAAGQIMLAFLQAVGQAVAPAAETMNNVLQSILDAIGGFFQSMFDAGANIIGSLIDGILSGLKPLGDALADIGDFIVSHKGPPSYDAVMLKPNAELIMGGLTDTIIDSIPALNRAMQMVNGAITVNATPTYATAGTADTGAIGGAVNVYVTVESREGEDAGAFGQRAGDAIALRLKMMGY